MTSAPAGPLIDRVGQFSFLHICFAGMAYSVNYEYNAVQARHMGQYAKRQST